MQKKPPAKRLTKNLGYTHLHRNADKAKAPTPAEKIISTKVEENGLTITDLDKKQCKWPTGYNEYGEITFCGKKKHTGENVSAKNPYCHSHYLHGLDKYRPKRTGVSGNTKEGSVSEPVKSSR